jgi:hypothetical protein
MNTGNEVLPEELSDKAAAIIADIRARHACDVRISVSRKISQEMLGIGATRQIELEAEGSLCSYLEGGQRRILVSSIYARLVALAIKSHPLAGAAKARQPAKRFSQKTRVRTPAELRGLAIGNARRAEEAKLRREAKVSRAP